MNSQSKKIKIEINEESNIETNSSIFHDHCYSNLMFNNFNISQVIENAEVKFEENIEPGCSTFQDDRDANGKNKMFIKILYAKNQQIKFINYVFIFCCFIYP
jgi:hypothetical protein